MTTPRLGMTEISAGQNGNEVRVNTALRRLESLLQARVLSRALSTPPGSPSNGDVYIPLATATGAWTGHDAGDEFAYYDNGWQFQDIPTGATMYIVAESKGFMWDGAALFEVATTGGGGGVNDGDILATGLTFPNTGLHVLDTDSSHDLILKTGSNLTADRTLTIITGDANRTLDISAGSVTVSAFGASLADDANAAAAQATLGLVIGTNVQAQDAELSALAGLTSAADKVPYFTGSGTAALADLTAAGRALIDDANAAAQRTTLGLGAAALLADPIPVANGGTGQTTEAIPETEDFYSTSTLAVGSTVRGVLNSTDGNLAIEVPAGKTLKLLSMRGHAKTGATAGTYTIDLVIWDATGGTVLGVGATATGTAATVVYPKATGTRASPLLSIAGSKMILVGIRNNGTSPGTLDATWKHRCKATYIIE